MCVISNICTCTCTTKFSCFLLVMGHVLANEIQIKDSMDVIQSLAADNDLITERERLHVEAAMALYAG